MVSPFSFKGQIRPLPYALWSFGLFFSQHLATLILFKAWGASLNADWWLSDVWWFYVAPLRSLVTHSRASDVTLFLALVYLLIVGWALAALAFRRAANADISEWIAAAAMAPIIQIPVILLLCVVPPRTAADRSPVAENADQPASDWGAAAQGLLAGLVLTLVSVAVGALVLGTYGYGMFVVSPFVIGAATAYFGNRKQDIGVAQTMTLVAGATALGGIALLVAALEGIVCLVLASPLGFGVALIGGVLGRAIALHTRRTPRQTLQGVAVLPLVFAIETMLSATASFDTYQTIAVHAPPEAVWKSIVNMGTIDEPLALPFRLGVAYALRGEIIGEGVGAVRRGEFSTGTALERVTEWVPNRKLAFIVVSDVPGMRELSPYEHVHAPHVVGYFRTMDTSFELLPRPNGDTEIVERTSHELRLELALYWLPMARWVVHENNARVLAHIRRRAEREFRECTNERRSCGEPW